MLISSANRPGLGGSHPPHSALARSSSRWLTGSQILSLRLPQTNQGLPSGQHGAPTTGKIITSWERKLCLGHLYTERATGVTARSGSHYHNNDDTANDNKHEMKTKAHGPAATAAALCNGELLTARYCLPSDSTVWVLCTNIY